MELRAEAPNVIVDVEELPNSGAGGSHIAIGQFSIKSELLTRNKIMEGDSLRVAITVTGKGEMSSVELPNLHCQSGFSGLFEISDLPIAGAELSINNKRFEIELKPLSIQIQEIPAITFVYFNPQTRSYETAETVPIPIKIVRGSTPAPSEPLFLQQPLS